MLDSLKSPVTLTDKEDAATLEWMEEVRSTSISAAFISTAR